LYYKTPIDPKKDILSYANVVGSAFYIRNRHIIENLYDKSIKAHKGEYQLFD